MSTKLSRIINLPHDLQRLVWYEYIDRLRVRMLHSRLNPYIRSWPGDIVLDLNRGRQDLYYDAKRAFREWCDIYGHEIITCLKKNKQVVVHVRSYETKVDPFERALMIRGVMMGIHIFIANYEHATGWDFVHLTGTLCLLNEHMNCCRQKASMKNMKPWHDCCEQ
jgi:hypothetical protein